MKKTTGFASILAGIAFLGLADYYLGSLYPGLNVNKERRQESDSDCGAASLQAILEHHGLTVPLSVLRQSTQTSEQGTSMLNLKKSAESFGLKAEGWKLTLTDLEMVEPPAIVFLDRHHFAVLRSVGLHSVIIEDPAEGVLHLSAKAFSERWSGYTLLISGRGDSEETKWGFLPRLETEG